MKFNAIVCAITAASLGFSALAFGADHDRRERNDRADQRREQRHDYQDQRRERQRDYRDDRRERRQDFQDERRNDRHNYYYNARGPEFRRGAPIPYEYRRYPYVVVYYRMHHLAPPPRGQHWVQVGPDYVLVAIATGLIVSIVLGY